MKVLFLGPVDSPLIEWLKSQGETVVQTSDAIKDVDPDIEFIISYGYRHLVKNPIIGKFDGRAINLHVSYLPWNRGADPNLWSFVNNTPKGVTIHYLDEGLDTGDIIVQKKVEFDENQTLKTSYEKLQSEIQELFKQSWAAIRSGTCPRIKQQGKGSYHKSKDKDRLKDLLAQSWDTPTDSLSAEAEMSQDFWDKYDLEIKEIEERKAKGEDPQV